MNVKKILIALLCIVVLASCGAKKEEANVESEEALAEWTELDAFHMLMAEVFHPLKDSGNVAPAKAMMAQLADEAAKWTTAPLPEKVNNDDMKAKLERLKTETRALADEITAGAKDEVISAKLYPLHDLFHEIQEAWYKKGDGEEHGDHKDHH